MLRQPDSKQHIPQRTWLDLDLGLPAHPPPGAISGFSGPRPEAERLLVQPLLHQSWDLLQSEPVWTSLVGPGPGAAEPSAFMHQFPRFPSSEHPGQSTRDSLLPSALAIGLESELSLPTLPFTSGSCANHFTDLWRARAEGLCRDPPTPLPYESENQGWQGDS